MVITHADSQIAMPSGWGTVLLVTVFRVLYPHWVRVSRLSRLHNYQGRRNEIEAVLFSLSHTGDPAWGRGHIRPVPYSNTDAKYDSKSLRIHKETQTHSWGFKGFLFVLFLNSLVPDRGFLPLRSLLQF